ncbi:S-formylglutathione hydrolase FrmB [Amycolatopsis arida]|uniref:S-formylglutathione hydrolase FrmB n=1 Tax=Amycolatopsis arida TaxID=587909 RepID=A0A1I5UP43_9PSEU|nr:alpha/beta hydrolase-fold protein [Amycolatopsis arida]TDX90977.1 S-formylglutathione hydrolase FrmB [Amycolatopsis arida]SFP97019.1 S-formylglutathione hydrolase FrmB [Amycolatopsis arida]
MGSRRADGSGVKGVAVAGPDGGRRHSRRSVLLATASGLGVSVVAGGIATDTLPVGPAMHRTLGVASGPEPRPGRFRVERVYSAARGREVDLVTMLPTSSPRAGLPMALFLHGRGGSARAAAPSGLLRQLATDVARRAVPAFGFVAVDGGDHYWHENRPGDDPMRMLLEEVPRWLRDRGLGGADGSPFAAAGVSMGGFGALLYARRRVERGRPPAAVAALSPALITTWAEMSKRRAFSGMREWLALDPLRHVEALADVPTAVWCGTDDGFIPGVRRFIALARPEIGYTARGGHGDGFYRTVLPSLVRFLGRYLPATP